MSEYTQEQIETLCEVMHDAYEQAALETGWETQASSRKLWSSVPEANKATMRAAVRAMVESIAFGENLAKRDRDIAARAWDEGFNTGEGEAYEHEALMQWSMPHTCAKNPYCEGTE